VDTLTADPPPAAATEPPTTPGPTAASPEQPTPATATAPQGHGCARCGSPLAAGQDWCLQCGAGAPGSLGTPSWRSAGAILGAALVLALGAAAAGYAALSKSPPRARVLTTTVAAVPAATPPAATAPLGTPSTISPLSTVKPPKIPLKAITPKAITPPSTPSTGANGTSTTKTPSTATGGASGEPSGPSAIVLDTNAASTYNPYAYPATGFGDPSLAIDGDGSTGWTAQVDPATAPKMAEGLLIDLKSPQKLSALKLITTTPGLTIQLYGANGQTPPTSITDPAWVQLSHSMVVSKRHRRITLRESKRAFRFVTLWISRVPAASVGTPQAPGHVTVNELELFPAA
jgi:hypothetical protein